MALCTKAQRHFRFDLFCFPFADEVVTAIFKRRSIMPFPKVYVIDCAKKLIAAIIVGLIRVPICIIEFFVGYPLPRVAVTVCTDPSFFQAINGAHIILKKRLLLGGGDRHKMAADRIAVSLSAKPGKPLGKDLIDPSLVLYGGAMLAKGKSVCLVVNEIMRNLCNRFCLGQAAMRAKSRSFARTEAIRFFQSFPLREEMRGFFNSKIPFADIEKA